MNTLALREGLRLGNPNGLFLQLVEIKESSIAALRKLGHPVVHLQVVPDAGRILTLNQLDDRGLDPYMCEEIWTLIFMRMRGDKIRQVFLPHVPQQDLGNVLSGTFVKPPFVYLRLALGHTDIMETLTPNDLWTGHKLF